MDYESLIDELFKRGVSSPYEVVKPDDDLTHVRLAIANYDRQKRKKPSCSPGLLVWLIRNPQEIRKISPHKLEEFKAHVKSLCLALEGNVRWAVEETHEGTALALGITIQEVIDEVMWPGWVETPTHPRWAGRSGFVNEADYRKAVLFWDAIDRRERST